MRKHKGWSPQVGFGFTRGGQLQSKRDMRLPTVKVREGKGFHSVKARDMRAVLTVLDDHGPRCFVSYETIAAEADISRRAVARAIKGLVSLSVLVITKKPKLTGGVRNEYVIDWTTLARLAPPKSTVPTGQIVSAHGANRECPVGTLTAQEPPNEPPPPTPSRQTTDPWHEAAAEFADIATIGAIIALRRGQEAPQAFVQRARAGRATISLPENAKLVQSPLGALATFLRTGSWPVDGMLSPAEAAARQREIDRRLELARQDAEREAAYNRQVAAERAARLGKVSVVGGPA